MRIGGRSHSEYRTIAYVVEKDANRPQGKTMMQLWQAAGITICMAVSLPTFADSRKPVFIHASCEGKISSVALVAFENELLASEKYRMTPTLDDFGHMDEVQILYMNCTEVVDAAAIATNYGKARCMAINRCGSMIDGSSITATLCKSTPAECGHMLFTTFDNYASRTNPTSKAEPPQK